MSFKYQNSSATCKVDNPTEKALICVLASYADDNGRCYPSIEKLQELISASNKTVINTLKSLENKGLIKKHKRYHNSTEYEITLPGFVSMKPQEVKVKDLHIADRVNVKILHNETPCQSVDQESQSVDQGKVKVKDLHTNISMNISDITYNTPSYSSPIGEQAVQEEKPKPKKPKSIKAKRDGIDYEAIKEYWNERAVASGVSKIMFMNDSRVTAVNKALDYPALKEQTTTEIKRVIWAFFHYAGDWWFTDDHKHYVTLENVLNVKKIERWLEPLYNR